MLGGNTLRDEFELTKTELIMNIAESYERDESEIDSILTSCRERPLLLSGGDGNQKRAIIWRVHDALRRRIGEVDVTEVNYIPADLLVRKGDGKGNRNRNAANIMCKLLVIRVSCLFDVPKPIEERFLQLNQISQLYIGDSPSTCIVFVTDPFPLGDAPDAEYRWSSFECCRVDFGGYESMDWDDKKNRITILRGHENTIELCSWNVYVSKRPRNLLQAPQPNVVAESDASEDLVSLARNLYRLKDTDICIKELLKIITTIAPLDFDRISTPAGLFADIASYLNRRISTLDHREWIESCLALNNIKVLQTLADALIGNSSISERAAAGSLLVKLIGYAPDGRGNAQAATAFQGIPWLVAAVIENIQLANSLADFKPYTLSSAMIVDERIDLYHVSSSLLGRYADRLIRAAKLGDKSLLDKVTSNVSTALESILVLSRSVSLESQMALGRCAATFLNVCREISDKSRTPLPDGLLRTAKRISEDGNLAPVARDISALVIRQSNAMMSSRTNAQFVPRSFFNYEKQ